MPPLSTADQIDQELAAAALRKRQRGEKPSRDELSALRRFEKRREEEARWAYYATIPKRHWQQMAGRQQKVLNEQAARYGAPLGGRAISLPDVVAWLHSFLAKNSHKLLATNGEDPMSGEISPALERWREEKYQLARYDRLEREANLVPRETVHEALGRIAGLLRSCGVTLERHAGREARAILDETLDDCEREIERLCGETKDASEREG